MSIALRAALLGLFAALPTAYAATPATGEISTSNRQVSFESGPFLTSGGVFCDITGGCDDYTVTVDIPDDYATLHPHAVVRFYMSWGFSGDLYTFNIYDQDGNEVAASSQTNLAQEADYVPAGSGRHTLRLHVSPLAANSSVIHGLVDLADGDGEGPLPNPTGPYIPRFQLYYPPDALSGNVGEPSTGYNQSSKQAFILSGLRTLWAVFPQDQTPAMPETCDASWADRSSTLTTATTLDPIGITDSLVRGHETNRTFIGQLAGVNSLAAYSDDDGVTWIPMQGGPPAAATDHQTFGAGPYPPPLDALPHPLYPNALYYCGQDIGFASCTRSDDGGLTFNQPVPIYQIQDCTGIHGHLRVSPDGTIYVPNRNCGSQVAVTVSEDAGTTWTIRKVPGTVAAVRDTEIALSADNTGYYCFADGDGNAAVAITRDHGRTWTEPKALGKELGIKHVMFTQAVAGDGDRATCGYVGTTSDGNPVSMDFTGVWHVYFSNTYDGGKTWVTVNATPNDIVQGVGGIWNSGGGAQNRNLNDFNEMSLDEKGFPMYGYADGCIGDCELDPTQNTFAAFPRIVRQVGGRPLYHEFDGTEPRAPGRACLSGVRTLEKTQLNWRVPENGGATIRRYQVFRGTAEGAETLIGTTDDDTPGYIDRTADPAVEKYFYTVKAVNDSGIGGLSNEVGLPLTEPVIQDPCLIPGVRVATDASGDATGGNVNWDVLSLNVAEPPEFDGKLIFQIKVSSLASPPPGTMWAARFHTPEQPVSGTSDSFVALVQDASGQHFVYGTTAPLDLMETVPTDWTVKGTLDPLSSATADGLITLVVPGSLFDLQPGDKLSGLALHVHTGATASGDHITRSTNTLDTATSGASYRLRSADACLANTAPVARLVVTPTSGVAPLSTLLDASSSSDAEDSLVEYSLDPGDQTPVIRQSTPTLQHTYSTAGFYRASVQVKDARGLVSTNVAQVIVTVTQPSSSGGSSSSSSSSSSGGGVVPGTPAPAAGRGGRFGGSLDLVALLSLLVGSRLRRRRMT